MKMNWEYFNPIVTECTVFFLHFTMTSYCFSYSVSNGFKIPSHLVLCKICIAPEAQVLELGCNTKGKLAAIKLQGVFAAWK